MRSGTGRSRTRFKVSLPAAGATAAVAAVIALVVGMLSLGGSSMAPTGQTASVRTATVLLATEQAASRAFSANGNQASDTFCADLVPDYGVTTTSGSVNGTKVTIPTFSTPSTLGVNSKATALKLEQQNKRLWGDAINTALPKNANGKFTMDALETSVCSEPDYAAMMILGLSNVEIGGVTIAHLNPWMTRGSPSPLKTVKWANHCMNGSFAVQVKCAQVMQNTAYLLTKFQSMGVHKDSPSWYFKLRNGLVVGSVPPIESVYGSYPGYFLEFQYSTKTGGCFLHLGVNVGRKSPNGGDQRLVGFMCDQPQAPSHVVPTTQPASPPVSRSPQPHPPTSTPSTPPPTPSKSPCPCQSSPPATPTSTPTPVPSTSSPPTTQPPTSAPPTQCGCTATPTASPTVTQTQCGCTATPSDTPSATPSETYSTPPATDTPTDTASSSDTPTPQCTCMASNPDTVSQVQAIATSLGFNNIFVFGAYPPPGTKNGAAMVS